MRKWVVTSFIFISFLACTRTEPPIQNSVVVRVGTDELTASGFAKQLVSRAKYLDAVVVKDPSILNRIKSDIVREFIVSSFLRSWAKEKNISADSAEVTAEISRQQKNYPNNTAFQSALSKDGITYEQWTQKVYTSLLEKKLFQQLRSNYSPPLESEMQIYYDHNKDRFKKSRAVKVKQIVIDTEEGAKEIQKELKKGKSFEKLAEKYSISPEGKEGGLTSWIDTDTLEVYEDAFNLKPGSVSGILKSPYGYHLMLLVDKRPGGIQAFKDSKEQIRRILMESKEQASYSQWVEEQIRKNKVFKNENLISSIRVSTEEK